MTTATCVCGCTAGMHKTREGGDRGCRKCDGHAGGPKCTGFRSDAVDATVGQISRQVAVADQHRYQQHAATPRMVASDLTFEHLGRQLRMHVRYDECDADSPLMDMTAALDGWPGVAFYVEGPLSDLTISTLRVIVTIGAADGYVITLDPSTPVWVTD